MSDRSTLNSIRTSFCLLCIHRFFLRLVMFNDGYKRRHICFIIYLLLLFFFFFLLMGINLRVSINPVLLSSWKRLGVAILISGFCCRWLVDEIWKRIFTEITSRGFLRGERRGLGRLLTCCDVTHPSWGWQFLPSRRGRSHATGHVMRRDVTRSGFLNIGDVS